MLDRRPHIDRDLADGGCRWFSYAYAWRFS
jgi:hypothetical protein